MILCITKTGAHSKTFHLTCFCPDELVPITPDFFTFKQVRSKFVSAWVDNWNKQFTMNEDNVPPQFLAKSVRTDPTAARRRLIETFAFLTVSEVETIAARTCKEWLHVTRDQEQWKTRFLRQFHPTGTQADGDYRRKFIAYYQSTCLGCGKMFNPEKIARRCEFYNRVICVWCFWRPEFEIYSLKKFKRQALVTSETLQLLNPPVFIHEKEASSYLKILKERMVPYAEKRMRILLRYLKTTYPDRVTRGQRKELKAARISDFYDVEKPERYQCSRAVRQAFVFCGKSGENLPEEVETFLKRSGH